jgi:hypothetical protein
MIALLAAVAAVASAAPPAQSAAPAPAIVSGQPATEEGPASGAAAVPSDAGGEAQVRRDFQAAEALRGPLEGRWLVMRADGQPLYLFQLADPGGQPDPRAAAPGAPQIEGAWLDMQRPRASDGEGYIAAVSRGAPRLTIVFYEGGQRSPRSLALAEAGGGAWSGVIVSARERTRVLMRRDYGASIGTAAERAALSADGE